MGYSIITWGDKKGFHCDDCGMTSWNPNDVKHRYCGKCHKFHSDLRRKLYERNRAKEKRDG